MAEVRRSDRQSEGQLAKDAAEAELTRATAEAIRRYTAKFDAAASSVDAATEYFDHVLQQLSLHGAMFDFDLPPSKTQDDGGIGGDAENVDDA
jgi:hypothetical protein